MKKITLSLFIILASVTLHAQGLEGIIVERYYVSNTADSIGAANPANADGNLPVGSVTYRIYVDLVSGYTLQAVYGIPGHVLKFTTTTVFFNDETYGTPG